jgi:hypothetical protein
MFDDSLLVKANGVDGDYYLEGIGYREQELQAAKGSRFASEEPTGVAWASLGGYTHIFIKGVGLVDNPQANFVLFRSHEFPGVTLSAPMLSEDDAFNSQPLLGNIAYRVPAVSDLFGMPKDAFDHFSSLTFWIEVMAMHDLEPAHMKC